MNWPSWLKYKTLRGGYKILSAADYVGESLAELFGITTPKYYYEIEEAKRRQTLDKEEKENAWIKDSEQSPSTVSSQPKPDKIEDPQSN